MVDYGVEVVNWQLVVEDVFIVVYYLVVVFCYEGDLMGDFWEKGDQLIILVVVGDYEVNILFVYLLVLGEEVWLVVSFGIV